MNSSLFFPGRSVNIQNNNFIALAETSAEFFQQSQGPGIGMGMKNGYYAFIREFIFHSGQSGFDLGRMMGVIVYYGNLLEISQCLHSSFGSNKSFQMGSYVFQFQSHLQTGGYNRQGVINIMPAAQPDTKGAQFAFFTVLRHLHSKKLLARFTGSLASLFYIPGYQVRFFVINTIRDDLSRTLERDLFYFRIIIIGHQKPLGRDLFYKILKYRGIAFPSGEKIMMVVFNII